jgi:hypothetical protein
VRTLPPGCVERGQYLLSGRIHPRDAEPLTLAYATKHILTNRSLEADAFRRSREDQALGELRVALGRWPWLRFGEATLRALVAARGEECRRCRATMIARVGRLPVPPRDSATAWLLGGCARCAPAPAVSGSQRRRGSVSQASTRPVGIVQADLRRLPSDRQIHALYAAAGDALKERFVSDMARVGVHRAYDNLLASGVRP